MGKIGKLFTTILVLGAIAGIGVGGYYGYQYLKNRRSNDSMTKQNGGSQGNQSNNPNGKIDEKDPKNSGNKNNQNGGSSSENNSNGNLNVDGSSNENTNNDLSSERKSDKPTLKITDAIERMFYKPKNLIRVGHWNILNYGGAEGRDKKGPKVRAISELIYKSKLDVVGLTEINYNSGQHVQNIVDVLNEISGGNSYRYLIQPLQDANPTSSNATKEQVAIIYNSDKIREKNFATTGRSIQSYGTKNQFNGTSYKRPLFGAYFETIEGNKPFVSIFAHLDSPDAATGEQKDQRYPGQGFQEVAEALEIPNAFKYYEQLSNNASIIFGGDTNIKTENNSLFNSQAFKKYNIENYYGEMKIHENAGASKSKKYEFYETSLGRSEKSGYANAYDKLLFKENNGLNIINEYEKNNYPDRNYQNVSFKADIVNGFKNGIWDRNIILNLKPELRKNSKGQQISDFSFIRNKISDHTLVYLDFEVK
ncbi:MnuA family membrane nuclease [Mycoplasma phocoeninasale]|uniref:MnuA family membrane nuclease n=1 Tax=Mycoplasma phocoeninasale TaxID=2726117 RepID=UPI00196866BF|nr:hypothetical protein [Mycoplasma phocoeninasale]MBN0970810.1 hypothetical protein [Mycoplasma phocoeninasale]